MKYEDIEKLRDSLSAIEEAVGWMGDYRAALDELAALRELAKWNFYSYRRPATDEWCEVAFDHGGFTLICARLMPSPVDASVYEWVTPFRRFRAKPLDQWRYVNTPLPEAPR